MSEEREESSESQLQIEPLYNGGSKPIHPAIGIVDDLAYVGIWLPSRVTVADKCTERDVLYLVTSTHQLIPAEESALKKRGWKLAYKPTQYRGANAPWPIEDVQLFLQDPTPVDPVEIYKQVLESFRQFMDYIDLDMYVLQTLWCIGTYFHILFNAYPYQYLGGTKSSGKTKTLTLANCICFNAISSGNLSTSSMFRLVQNLRCTLLIDETEKLGVNTPYGVSETTREFRNLLLNGYKKGMPVHRTEKTQKDQFVVESFEVYAPKAIANISGLDDVLEDRCIPSFLVTAKDADKRNTEPELTDPRWGDLRAKLFRLFLDYWHEVNLCFGEISQLRGNLLVPFLSRLCPELNVVDLQKIAGRQLEIWKPIITLARFLDYKDNSLNLTQMVIKLAARKVMQRIGENLTETADMVLMETLLRMVSMPNWVDDYLSIRDIHGNMTARYEDQQKWLTNDWVGRALRRLGFVDKRRLGSSRQVRVAKQAVLELASRYNVVDSMAQATLDSDSPEPSQVEKASQVEDLLCDTSDSSDTSDALRRTTRVAQDSAKAEASPESRAVEILRSTTLPKDNETQNGEPST